VLPKDLSKYSETVLLKVSVAISKESLINGKFGLEKNQAEMQTLVEKGFSCLVCSVLAPFKNHFYATE